VNFWYSLQNLISLAMEGVTALPYHQEQKEWQNYSPINES
jgi:hypothetical protein